MKKALLVIDYTYDFVADDGKLTCGGAGQAIEGALCKLIDDAALQGEDIFVLNDLHKENDALHPEAALFPPHNIENTAGRELYGKVKAAVECAKSKCPEKVHLLDKCRYSAFMGTPLDQLLRERHVDTVVLTGVCTDICVLHTAVSAYGYGYNIIVPRDAVASFNPAGHEFALAHFEGSLGAALI